MKKPLFFSLLSATLLLSACQPRPMPQSQTFGASSAAQPMSIQQALTAQDDRLVTIEGRILSHVDDDEYIVSDHTGQIRVEIDDDVWQGQQVNSQDRVRLYGEIDKNWHRTELKVRTLTRLP